MDIAELLRQLKASPDYAGQIVYTREVAAREARYAAPAEPLHNRTRQMLATRGIERLYSHQAEAIDAFRHGEDILTVTGTASGKSLCYIIPIIETLLADPEATALLLFPTKALSQDQYKGFRAALDAAGLDGVLAGIYDGDTPANLRRKLRDGGRLIFTNPDMLHAGMMPQHGRWSEFLSNLRIIVIDEMHVYTGIFGANMANLMKRFFRLCTHYGSRPQLIGSSATVGNPAELGERVTTRSMRAIDDDGSPRGKRTYVLWNPPQIRAGMYRSRRSANVEAHEVMAKLIQHGFPTIAFSKTKMTAEMIYRYVCDKLGEETPGLVKKVSPYRGGYLPEERRDIEARLFSGELMGVSTTRALELGIDVGGLDASIIVGYPGRLASFFQQSGRAGRQSRDSLVVLVGLDTAINQYIMTHPEYLFGRPVEEAVIDAENPFVIIGHVRCATHELPLSQSEARMFGPHVATVLRLLQENRKIREIDGIWYHATSETPQHEVPLRNGAVANVIIQDIHSGAALGQICALDAPPILHPDAIYMHQGDTYIVRSLDMERNLCQVERVEVDYNTQPLDGTSVHHIDHQLRDKPFGTGNVCWGEVSAYSHIWAYEKVHFYTLDAVSRHPVHLPKTQLETMGVWIVPPEELMDDAFTAGLNPHGGLRGIGYAVQMLLPTFITCDTQDFANSIGSANSPWNAIFIYERYPLGLGFTEKAYDRMHEILPAALEHIQSCPCADGCPCCVGRPLRGYDTWNVERGEGEIPSKQAAIMILEGLLGDMTNLQQPDRAALTDSAEDAELRLERVLRRRLERMREPKVFHPIEPKPETEVPNIEADAELETPDVAIRHKRGVAFEKDLHKRLAKKLSDDKLDPFSGKNRAPKSMRQERSGATPVDFAGHPEVQRECTDEDSDVRSASARPPQSAPAIQQGDALAAKARRLKKKRKHKEPGN